MTVITSVAMILAVLLTITMCALLAIVRRSRSRVWRLVAGLLSGIAVLISPGLFDMLVTHLNHTSGITYLAIDPGWAIKVTPAVISLVVALAVIPRMSPRSQPPQT